MKHYLLTALILITIIGCSGENKVSVSGVIAKQNNTTGEFFVVKDSETGKLYRFDKKSEKDIADKIGHSIKMQGKILKSTDTSTSATISICTKCHHNMSIN